MTWEEMLAVYNKRKTLTKNIPHAVKSEEELRKIWEDPVFQRRQKLGEQYLEQRNAAIALSDGLSRSYVNIPDISRFMMHLYQKDGTEEAREYNEDFRDMLLSNEGLQAASDIIFHDMAGCDLSLSYPKDADEAIDNTLRNPGMTEQMMTIWTMMSNDHKPFRSHPLIEETLKYNKTALEGSPICYGTASFYGSDWTAMIHPEQYDVMDFVMASSAVGGPKLDRETQKLTKMLGLNYKFQSEADILRGAQELREQGILGPESKYYRAFDETGKRMTFDNAIKAFSEGKKVDFRKMSPEEQKEFDEALRHPTTLLEKTAPGALYGKEFQKECGELYEMLRQADSHFVRSSDEYSNMKKALKEMSGRGTVPNADDAKKFLRGVLAYASDYVNKKTQAVNAKRAEDKSYRLSDFEQKRFDTMNAILNRLSPKLGMLAYESYRVRTASRDIHTENQADMTDAMNREQAVRTEMKAQSKDLAKGLLSVRPSDAGNKFANLAKQAEIGSKGMLKTLQSTQQQTVSADKEFTNGRYLSQLAAYGMIVEERARVNGPDYLKSDAPIKAGPMEQLLNEVGSHAFYKSVQNSSVMQDVIKDGITVPAMKDFLSKHEDHALIGKLSSPAVQKELREKAAAYAEKAKELKAPSKEGPTV